MLNLQTLTAKARELRGNVVKAVSTKGSRTMTLFMTATNSASCVSVSSRRNRIGSCFGGTLRP